MTSLGNELLAVAREALSNVAKHAKATAAEVSVEVREGMLSIWVTDNGVGPTTIGSGSGLNNLRSRAEHRRGTFELRRSPTGGSVAAWTARIDADNHDQ